MLLYNYSRFIVINLKTVVYMFFTVNIRLVFKHQINFNKCMPIQNL